MEAEKSIQKVKETQLRAESQFCDKQKFKNIPKQERSAYIKTMLAVQQLPGPPPFSFKKPYLSESQFPYKGHNLHYYATESSPAPKAILFYFHGMNGHGRSSGYFNNTIRQYIGEMNVYACDQMNFGKSEGPFRGLVSSLDQSVEQCENFVDFILSKLKSKPKIFISGGSYGGTICFKMALRSPQKYSGIIFLAPGLRVLNQKFKIIKYAVKVMACILPPLRTYTEKQFNTSTRYNNKEEIIAQNLIYNDGAIPHSGNAIFDGINSISTQYHLLTTPYILFQGGVDKMIDPFAPLDLEEASPSKDKTTLYCQGMWHAVHAQREISEITDICKQWIKDRV